MIVVATTGTISLILFAIASVLFVRAAATPPPVIRTESRRSQAEYAHHRHRALMRRSGYMLVLAAAMNLGICLTMGLVEATIE